MDKKKVSVGTLLVLSLFVLSGLGFGVPSLVSQGGAIAAAPTAVSTTTNAPIAQNSALAAFQGTLEQIYNQVNPSVVAIQVTQSTSNVSQGTPEIPGSPFGQGVPQQPQQALGSGFVWDKQGHIVTNNHVVEGASQISVVFSDGTIVGGTVVGTDPQSDLAVVQVDVPASQLQPVQIADSSQLKVGQIAIAIGNPFGEQGTMTVGIVSGLGRSLPVTANTSQSANYTIPDVIQTDAPINPGNSGGVLVNDQGQVIGVTSAIESPVQANAGVGFAIPSNIVEKVAPSLISTGSYEHPWLGISGTSLTPDLAQAMGLNADQRGALVVSVVPGSPADTAGLQGSDRQVDINGFPASVGGDVIVAVDGQPVKSFGDLTSYLANNGQVGQTITLTILRGGNQESVDVTLAARPTQAAAQQSQPTGGTGGGWLGILGLTMTPEIAQAMSMPTNQQGVLIQRVVQGSPADEAGLQGSFRPDNVNGQQFLVGGDVIVAWDNQQVINMQDLQSFLQQSAPGDTVLLTIIRDGGQMDVSVTLGQQPVAAP